MTDKVTCPYCPGGVEMEVGYMLDAVADEHSLSGISYKRYVQCQCPICKSTSPRAITPETALMLAHRRANPQNRALTLEEVKNIARRSVLWCEGKDGSGQWMDAKRIKEILSGNPFFDEENYYVGWRCWLYKPTDEERQNTPWEVNA